ncbi:MAG: DUF721 domain-containing protein [Alkalispirochaeta sp.]
MGSYGEHSAKDLIARFVESIGIHDEIGVVPFVRAWPRIAGADLAAHSQILDIRNGALLLGVDHPGWLQRINMERRRIIAAVQREFPALEVRYLHLTVIERLDPSVQPSIEERTASGTGESRRSGTEEAVRNQQPMDEEEGADTGLSEKEATETPRAGDDQDFQRYLENLGKAIERKNPE